MTAFAIACVVVGPMVTALGMIRVNKNHKPMIAYDVLFTFGALGTVWSVAYLLGAG